MEDYDGRRFSYCLVARKARLHVGPRYKARGLNDHAAPGNELECEQVVWRHAEVRGRQGRGPLPLAGPLLLAGGSSGKQAGRQPRQARRRRVSKLTRPPAAPPPGPQQAGGVEPLHMAARLCAAVVVGQHQE